MSLFRNAEILEVTQFACFRNMTKYKFFGESSNIAKPLIRITFTNIINQLHNPPQRLRQKGKEEVNFNRIRLTRFGVGNIEGGSSKLRHR